MIDHGGGNNKQVKHDSNNQQAHTCPLLLEKYELM